MQNEPVFRKCCGCVPLSVCLHIWAAIKLIGDLLLLGVCFFVLIFIFVFSAGLEPNPRFGVYAGGYFLIFLIVDIYFTTTLICGWGILNKLNMFLRYGVCMICAEVIFLIMLEILACREKNMDWYFMSLFSLFYIVWIGIDICMMLTLKSKIVKLQNKALNVPNRTQNV